MSAKDISRFLFQPQKRYSGVRMQQGRVILDSDWNESERIDDEEARRTLLDILCAKGTSNRGFLVGAPTPATVEVPAEGDGEERFTSLASYDFPVAGGSFYLGGLRFEVPAEGERFLDQSDWLQLDAGPEALPPAPSVEELTDAAGNVRPRFDLVYLRGWEQCVTAVEDSELRERALGGPDTSVRIRRMRRFEVLPGGPEGCSDAFAELVRRLTAPRPGDGSGTPHGFDPESCELTSKARLTVGTSDGTAEDLCTPPVRAGFLGAENQTIRVELTATDRFIWGVDNASPYYRVQVVAEDGRAVKVKFLTLPRDQHAQPLQGQAVEIHPWGALLPNGEKVAELGGHLATVERSYDPETRTLTIADPLPQPWLDWLDAPSHAEYLSDHDPDGQQKYFYLRLWTGGSGEAAVPDFPFTPGTPVPLAGTGLTVTFSDPGLPGDHWILAGRPHTPDVVVAWELMDGAPPAGTRFFFAPLAVIRWTVVTDPDGEEVVHGTVHDCRSKFRPLCEVRGCCTVTVGDGVASHGDFASIQEAVDSLPPEGGEVCVLPGVHRGRVEIVGRRNVRIHGCGKQSLILPGADDLRAPLFRLVDCRCITLERLTLATLEGTAVVVTGSEEIGSHEIEISHNRILAFEEGIRVEAGGGVEIHHNLIRMLDKVGAGVGIRLAAEDALIERNDIAVVPAGRRPPPGGDPGDGPDPEDPCADPEGILGNLPLLLGFLSFLFRPLVASFATAERRFEALGGIQLAAGAERVTVLENRIGGGGGNGITLGGTARSADEPPDGGEPEDQIFDNEVFSEIIAGTVFEGGERRSGVGVSFTDEAGTTTTAVSDPGYFVPISGPGNYRVRVTSPGFELERLEFSIDSLNEFPRLDIHVRRVEPRPDPALGFLRQIRILENEIEGMDLSGIGIPHDLGTDVIVNRFTTKASRLARATVARFGNPVLGLEVHRNAISHCLQRPFDATLDAVTRSIGLGGISLGMAFDVAVSENRIGSNGRRHVDPVCGIFIALGHWVAIRENIILDNGPLTAGRSLDVERGIRGGIVVRMATAAIVATLDRARPTATIDHNVVSQPAGRALDVTAVGPVSVDSNQLSTLLTEPEVFGQGVSVGAFGDGRRLPPADVLFVNNRTRHGNEPYNRLHFISTQGDLIYKGNHCHAEGAGFATAWLFAGRTLMAVHNRFDERSGATLSASTQGLLMNDTSDNQANHCIEATSPGLLKNGPNQILDTAGCDSRGVIIRDLFGTFFGRRFTEDR